MPKPRAAAILLAALVACSGGTPASEQCIPHGLTSVGERLPDCTFSTIGGPALRLRALEGKPLLLNFWASWCVACVKEMPDFQRVADRAGDRLTVVGMDVLGVLGETRSAAERFVRTVGVGYRIAFDPDGLLYAHFSARPLLPLTVFVDERGIVKERHIGQLSLEEVLDRIRRNLNMSL